MFSGRFVRWQQTPQGLESRLNEVLSTVIRMAKTQVIRRCVKGVTGGRRALSRAGRTHQSQYPGLLPELMAANIASVKIEGRQRARRMSARWRKSGVRLSTVVSRSAKLHTAKRVDGDARVDVEGTQTTLGAYHRKWQ